MISIQLGLDVASVSLYDNDHYMITIDGRYVHEKKHHEVLLAYADTWQTKLTL